MSSEEGSACGKIVWASTGTEGAIMMAMDDPDTVHQYCCRLIQELGPEGFILHSGCDIPDNAKLENVQAMVASVMEG